MRDLAQQRVQIRRSKTCRSARWARFTNEQYAQRVEQNGIRNLQRKDRPRRADFAARTVCGSVDAELRPLQRRNKINLAQQPFRIPRCRPASDIWSKVSWAARRSAPQGGARRPAPARPQIIAALQNAPRRAHVGILQPHAVTGEAGPAAIRDLRRRGQILFAARERGDSPVAGERRGAELAQAPARTAAAAAARRDSARYGFSDTASFAHASRR